MTETANSDMIPGINVAHAFISFIFLPTDRCFFNFDQNLLELAINFSSFIDTHRRLVTLFRSIEAHFRVKFSSCAVIYNTAKDTLSVQI